MPDNPVTEHTTTRRTFMGQAAALGVGALAAGALSARAADVAPLRVGLIGCGRRGTGAANDCMKASENVTISAAGDLFPDALEAGLEKLRRLGDRFTAAPESCFSGWDAYQRVIDSDVDVVLLCEPPGFRPLTLRAAVEAGKHVFMEKPAAVDPAGVRSVLESARMAEEKGLSIVAGTQRRHQPCYRDIVQRIHDGAIGDIVSAACYWIGDYDYYPAVPRQADWSDMEWQIRNWNYFTWLSGDHIVEQHLHNIDVINWVLGAHPIKAVGMGGRAQRTGPEYGHIYDHFSVEFEYPGDIRVQSLCRQNKDTYRRVGEYIVGTKGASDAARNITGAEQYQFQGQDANPYQQEHANLIAAIRAGEPLNEGRALAESTLAAVMGRMSAYTGQEVAWDWALNESQLDLTPPAWKMGPLPVPPVAVPGIDGLV